MFASFGVTVFWIRLNKPKRTHTDAYLNFFTEPESYLNRAVPAWGQEAMIRSAPSIQQICLKSVIDHQKIDDVLYPELDWDNDVSHLFNERLTREEERDYELLAVTGQKTLTECKNDLRSLLYRRPFDLDLVQMRKLPLFDGLPDYSVKQVWAESIILEWERHVPAGLCGLIEWGELIMTWRILNSLLDGCTNLWLFEVLEEEKLPLIEKDNDELWRIEFGSVWLQENMTIDK